MCSNLSPMETHQKLKRGFQNTSGITCEKADGNDHLGLRSPCNVKLNSMLMILPCIDPRLSNACLVASRHVRGWKRPAKAQTGEEIRPLVTHRRTRIGGACDKVKKRPISRLHFRPSANAHPIFARKTASYRKRDGFLDGHANLFRFC